MKTIDYYEHWNKVRKKKTELLDREKISFGMIKNIMGKNKKFIDMGCGNGDFLIFLKKYFDKTKIDIKLKGIDYSPSEVKEAKHMGLDVEQSNFEEGIKLKDSYDVAYAGEVIEHLYNPDLLLSETNKILKNGGYVIITTPNLCAWFNRILMPFGVQPLFLEPSTKSKLVGSGFLKRFKKGHEPVGHIRIFTLAALKDLLKMNGFKIIDVKGAIYDEGFPGSIQLVDKFFNLFPTLASHFVILAKKVK